MLNPGERQKLNRAPQENQSKMQIKTEAQAGQIIPAELKLAPDAFFAELRPIVGTDKVGWTADEHIGLVEALLGKLRDTNGNAPLLPKEQMNVLKLIFRPTEDLQRSVLRQTFKEAGYKLAPDTEHAFVMLLSAPQFADFLAKTVNPETKQPFIKKEKKRGVKKDTLTSLISAATPAASTASSKALVVADPTQPPVATTEPQPEAGK